MCSWIKLYMARCCRCYPKASSVAVWRLRAFITKARLRAWKKQAKAQWLALSNIVNMFWYFCSVSDMYWLSAFWDEPERVLFIFWHLSTTVRIKCGLHWCTIWIFSSLGTEHPHFLQIIISNMYFSLTLYSLFQNFSTDHSVPPRKTHIRCAAVFLCYFEETDAHWRRLDAADAARPLKVAFVRASAAQGSARSQLFAARSTVCRRTHNRKLSSPRRPLSIPCG